MGCEDAHSASACLLYTSSFDSTDSKVNLTDAFLCACCDTLHGVMIVFNGKVIQGTRACKTRTKSYDCLLYTSPMSASTMDGMPSFQST